MSIGAWIWIFLFLIGIILFSCYSQTKRFLRCLLFTAFTGLAALGLVWMSGQFFEINLGITPLSIGISGLLGVPGVVAMLLLNLL